MSMPTVRYSVEPADLAGHLFSVHCRIDSPSPTGQRLWLPAWIPGSYMIRDFARNIVTIEARNSDGDVPLEKVDKHTWLTHPLPEGEALDVRYTVYAWDLSVRTAHLDQTHGFFNGTSLFLAVAGKEAEPCLVDLRAPAHGAIGEWRVATALPEADGITGAAPRHGFGLYRAENYDELVDHPVEMGAFTLGGFEAGGVPHEVVLTGRHDCDLDRLCEDLARICQWHIDLFGAPPPMDRYLFLTMVVGEGYGGLEHRASTALLTRRADLPWRGMKGVPEGYHRFLGLCSHEYFHSWNVKRIKPAAFLPYDLTRESHTRLLWAFEGFTSYYDELALVRSGTIDAEAYLTELARTITVVTRGSGRLKQSVAESSFDAWTKFYRQDENSANAIVSYYTKGSFIALALDLQLRLDSDGEKSLDDVMRALWQQYGQPAIGVPETGVFDVVAEIGGQPLADWLRAAVEGTDDPELGGWLEQFGVKLERESSATPSLGVKLKTNGEAATLATVYDDSPARAAGLSAEDTLLAVDGLKVTRESIDAMLSRHTVGDTVVIHAFRRDELMRFAVTLGEGESTVKLALLDSPSALARRLRLGWLGS